MLRTDLIDAIKALGNPENMDDQELGKYMGTLEFILEDYGFKYLHEETLEVDDHGEALKMMLFYNKGTDTTIGHFYRVHPEYGLVSVYNPYYMKKEATVKYKQNKPVVEKY